MPSRILSSVSRSRLVGMSMRSAAARAAASAAARVSSVNSTSRAGMSVASFSELRRPLRRRVEQPERLDRVAEQLDAQRPAVERAEDVDDPAAGREGAQVLDQRRRLVAHVGQPAEEGVAVEVLAHAHHLAQRVQHVRREHPLVERAPGEHQRREPGPLAQVEQRAEPLGDHGRVGRQLVPGQHLVAGELQHVGLHQRARAAEEERQIRGQLLGRVLVRGDAQQRRPQLARQPGQHVPPRRALQPGGPHPRPRPELRPHPLPADRPRGAPPRTWAGTARREARTSRGREPLRPGLPRSTAALRRGTEPRARARESPRKVSDTS